MLARAAVIKRLDWVWSIHFQGGLFTEMLAEGLISLPCRLVLITWYLASPKANDPREKGWSCCVFYDLASEITHNYFHNILQVVYVIPIQHGRGLQKSVNPRRQGSVTAILETSYHVDDDIVMMMMIMMMMAQIPRDQELTENPEEVSNTPFVSGHGRKKLDIQRESLIILRRPKKVPSELFSGRAM